MVYVDYHHPCYLFLKIVLLNLSYNSFLSLFRHLHKFAVLGLLYKKYSSL